MFSVPLPSTVALLFVLLCAAGASAQTLQIPVGQQAGQHQQIERPERGMDQQQVLARYGEPLKRSAKRGEPPISHWQYPLFTVYFEYQTVIHSVLHQQPQAAQ